MEIGWLINDNDITPSTIYLVRDQYDKSISKYWIMIIVYHYVHNFNAFRKGIPIRIIEKLFTFVFVYRKLGKRMIVHWLYQVDYNLLYSTLHFTGLKGAYCDHFFTTLTHLKLVEIFTSYERLYFSHQHTEIWRSNSV